MLFTTISTSKKVLSFRVRAEKGIVRHIDASGLVADLVIFDWFVLSMSMQVILDSSFARPRFSPYMGREERGVQGLDYSPPDRCIQAILLTADAVFASAIK